MEKPCVDPARRYATMCRWPSFTPSVTRASKFVGLGLQYPDGGRESLGDDNAATLGPSLP